jgi:hypothetical protein
MQLFIFISQAMNVFVNLFGHTGKFSVKDGKSNLRTWSLTDGSRHDSFHLDFLWKEGRKIAGSHQKSAASGGQRFPDSLGNSQGFLSITFYSPLSRRNFQNSGSPNEMNECVRKTSMSVQNTSSASSFPGHECMI